MKSTNNIHLAYNKEISKTVPVEDANMYEEVFIVNQTTSYSAQFTRNLPNILRSSNVRACKKHKALTLNKTDTSFISSAKDVYTSFDLNGTLSSTDSEKEGKYNKIVSSKLYHRRKQVHNPLDIRCDVPDWNNNKDKDVLQTSSQMDMLHVPLSHKKHAPRKKLKLNSKRKSSKHTCLFNKRSRTVATRKSGKRAKESDEKSIFDSGFITAPNRNMIDDIAVQNANNLYNNDILSQSISNYDIPDHINDFPILSSNDDIETKTDELSNISCCNKEIYNLEKDYDINHNALISGNSTESNVTQYKTFQKDLSNYQYSVTKDGFEEDLVDRDITSNFLLASNILYTCTYKNCTSHCDKDVILYEDPIPSCANNDTETELTTSCTYDLCSNDYYRIFDDNWLNDFDKKDLCFEEIEETRTITQENASGGTNITKPIESNVNMSTSIEQSESQISQSHHIDRVEDICAKSYPTRPITHSNEPTESFKPTEHIKILDETGCLNLGNISMEESKMIPQNETVFQTTVPTNVPAPKSEHQPCQNTKATDMYLIQCSQCRKVFNKTHQFRKHFTHCSFYKEDFKCHICNRIYRYKSSLVQHLKNAHCESHHNSYEKSYYACNKCNKLYVRFRAFQRHLLLHDNDW